jgi:hypothetical protein
MFDLSSVGIGVGRVYQSVEELHRLPDAHCRTRCREDLLTDLQVVLESLLRMLFAAGAISLVMCGTRGGEGTDEPIEATRGLVRVFELTEGIFVGLAVKM